VSDSRFERAIAAIDVANEQDPRTEAWAGEAHPKELIYGRRMSAWLKRLEPHASEALRLACRAQHIKRWTHPRNRYPMDRRGYHCWRTELYGFHADEAGRILREMGYDEPTIDRVRELLQKKQLKSDPEAQLLEDVACLVFLEFYFVDFARGYDEGKVIAIVQKTWKKMSQRGHAAALTIDLPDEARRIIERGLA
jgi:hypothetical protein